MPAFAAVGDGQVMMADVLLCLLLPLLVMADVMILYTCLQFIFTRVVAPKHRRHLLRVATP